MDSPTINKDETDVEKIYVDLEQLKKQINHFLYSVEGNNAKEPEHAKITTLTAKTKRLLQRHKKIKEELEYYENVYRKALIKNVKNLKSEIKQDKTKLKDLKEKCRTQGVHVEIALMKMKQNNGEKSKTPSMIVPSNNKDSPTIKDKIKIKMRTKTTPARRKIFKQKRTKINDNVKIQIQKNKIGERELVFFNSNKTKERFSNLVQKKEIKPFNLRECRIMLQKLTEEQAKQYNGENKLEQQENQQKSQESSPQNSKSKSPGVKPKWRISIPKGVLEEIQDGPQNSKSNTPQVRRKLNGHV